MPSKRYECAQCRADVPPSVTRSQDKVVALQSTRNRVECDGFTCKEDPVAYKKSVVTPRKLFRISIAANFDLIDEIETHRREFRPYLENGAQSGKDSDKNAISDIAGLQPVPREDAVMLAKYLASRDSTVTETLAVVASGSGSGSGSGSAAAASASTDRLREKTQQVDALLQQLKQAGGGNGGNSTRL
ncbi:hypothetical protein RB213_005249 [Colletotrichum asianum]